MCPEFSNVRHFSYWQDQLDPLQTSEFSLPEQVDVLIVGSGYTGLNAAIITARGGRSTLVLDKLDLGSGCSTKNGGQISPGIKPSLSKLTSMFGGKRALAIRAEGVAAMEWLAGFVKSENLGCDFFRSGRFHAAHTPQHFERLVRDAEKMRLEEGIESFAINRQDQHTELGSDLYFGGVVFPRYASVHPAKLYRAFLHKALNAGAHALGNCAVLDIEKTGRGFEVKTEKGRITARDVIVATNGYSSALVPWLRRRIIPIGSYVIATEQLPEQTIKKLFPKGRVVCDTRKVVYYYRPSPDGRRVVFGGRVSSSETDTTISAKRLYAKMCQIFPELQGTGISHSWSGTVAYSFDELAHTGIVDGIHYAQGYCGSGVSMASYLGMRAGQKVLGIKEGASAFDNLPYPTRPFYTGKPWFLPSTVAYYQMLDEWQRWMALGKS